MKEKHRYFAIIPIHGRNAFIEAELPGGLTTEIDEVLKIPEKDFPNHDFRSEITVIKGKKIKLPHD